MANKTTSICFLTLCAGGLAAFGGWQLGDRLSAHDIAHDMAGLADNATASLDSFPIPNRDSKRDRDIVVASAAPEIAPVESADPPSVATPPAPMQIAPPEKPADLQNARAELSPPPAVAPVPRAKPVAKIEKIEKMGRAFLNDFQIAGIKQRLNLTAAQERYWPPVEKALRGLTEQVMDYQKRLKKHDDSFDTESAEIKQLKGAAKPFLAQLRDDQKSEVLMLANMSGLGPIVSQLASDRDVATNGN